jgi:hypothetical protein
LVYRCSFFRAPGINARTSLALFILKLLAGIALLLIYTFYYTDRETADIYKYFDDSLIIHELLFNDPGSYFQILIGINSEDPHLLGILDKLNYWYKPFESSLYNDNRTIIKFNVLARLISFGSIGVHTVIMCFISYVGLLTLYKFAVQFAKAKEKILVFVVFLLPSVLFWGSGLLKEGMLLFALGVFIYSCDRACSKGLNAKITLSILFSLLLLLICKIYIIIAVAPLILAYCWSYRVGFIPMVLRYCLVLCIGLAVLWGVQWINPDLDLTTMLSNKQGNFMDVAAMTNANSVYSIPLLEPNALSIMKSIPIAIFNVLFRPHLGEIDSPMMALAALENLMILLFITVALIFMKKKIPDWNFLFFCIGFVVVLYALIGMVTPILGAVVRYKIPALPFLLLIFLALFDQEKFMLRFPRFNFLKT